MNNVNPLSRYRSDAGERKRKAPKPKAGNDRLLRDRRVETPENHSPVYLERCVTEDEEHDEEDDVHSDRRLGWNVVQIILQRRCFWRLLCVPKNVSLQFWLN